MLSNHRMPFNVHTHPINRIDLWNSRCIFRCLSNDFHDFIKLWWSLYGKSEVSGSCNLRMSGRIIVKIVCRFSQFSGKCGGIFFFNVFNLIQLFQRISVLEWSHQTMAIRYEQWCIWLIKCALLWTFSPQNVCIRSFFRWNWWHFILQV